MKKTLCFRTLSFKAILVFLPFISFSCTDTPKDSHQESYRQAAPCSTIKQDCLNLFTQHSSEISRAVKARSQGTDPDISDVLSSVNFVTILYDKEEQIRQNCPDEFKIYENERDNLVAVLIAKELATELFK